MNQVAGSFRVPVENLEAIRPLMRAVIASTVQEDGCLTYSYAEDVSEPGLIRVFEQWRDGDCLAAHFTTAHMRKWVEERAGFGLFGRDIRTWEVGEGKPV